MKHVGARGERHVGAVVHREQRAVPFARLREDFQVPQLVPGFEALLAELDDVHPAGQRRIEELRQVATVGTRVCT